MVGVVCTVKSWCNHANCSQLAFTTFCFFNIRTNFSPFLFTGSPIGVVIHQWWSNFTPDFIRGGGGGGLPKVTNVVITCLRRRNVHTRTHKTIITLEVVIPCLLKTYIANTHEVYRLIALIWANIKDKKTLEKSCSIKVWFFSESREHWWRKLFYFTSTFTNSFK